MTLTVSYPMSKASYLSRIMLCTVSLTACCAMLLAVSLADAVEIPLTDPNWIFSATEPPTLITPSPEMAAGTISGVDSAFRFSGANSGTNLNNNPFRRELNAPATSDIYFRYLVRPEAGFSNGDFIVFWLDDEIGGDDDVHNTSSAFLGLRVDGGSGQQFLFSRINNTSEQNLSVSIADGEDSVIMGRLFKTGGTYDRLSFWLNPTLGDEGTPIATVALDTGLTTMTHFGLRTGQLTQTTDSYLFGGLAIGDSFANVLFQPEPVPIPEPASMTLLGLLLPLAACGKRRRRDFKAPATKC